VSFGACKKERATQTPGGPQTLAGSKSRQLFYGPKIRQRDESLSRIQLFSFFHNLLGHNSASQSIQAQMHVARNG
jgi:hypothetical protein